MLNIKNKTKAEWEEKSRRVQVIVGLGKVSQMRWPLSISLKWILAVRTSEKSFHIKELLGQLCAKYANAETDERECNSI